MNSKSSGCFFIGRWRCKNYCNFATFVFHQHRRMPFLARKKYCTTNPKLKLYTSISADYKEMRTFKLRNPFPLKDVALVFVQDCRSLVCVEQTWIHFCRGVSFATDTKLPAGLWDVLLGFGRSAIHDIAINSYSSWLDAFEERHISSSFVGGAKKKIKQTKKKNRACAQKAHAFSCNWPSLHSQLTNTVWFHDIKCSNLVLLFMISVAPVVNEGH